MRLLTTLFLALLALACTPVGGGGGPLPSPSDDLPWVECEEKEGEAPCCPRINVEDYCLDDETLVERRAEDPATGERTGRLTGLYCEREDGTLMVGVSAGSDYVGDVFARDGRLWVGVAQCKEDGRTRFFRAQDVLAGEEEGCIAACYDIESICIAQGDACPERLPEDW